MQFISYSYLSFPSRRLVLSFFSELRLILNFLVEESGGFPKKGELDGWTLCALFVFPLDSSQEWSLASMSTLTFGVSCLWAEGTKLVMWRDRAAKLTVWTDSWYSPGFYNHSKTILVKIPKEHKQGRHSIASLNSLPSKQPSKPGSSHLVNLARCESIYSLYRELGISCCLMHKSHLIMKTMTGWSLHSLGYESLHCKFFGYLRYLVKVKT